MRLIDYVDRVAKTESHQPALIADGVTMSFAALSEQAGKAAMALRSLDLPAGSTVAILSDNASQVCVLQIAINAAGLAWTSIHPSVTDETAAQVLDYLDTRFIFFQKKYAEKAGTALEGVEGLSGAVCIDAESGDSPSLVSWMTERAEASTAHPCTSLTGLTAAWLQHTGGPAGPCHGTLHSRFAIEMGLANVVDAMDIATGDRHFVVAPLTHAAGIFALAFTSVGAANVIETQFNPERLDAALRDEGITHVFLPPTALYALMDHVGGPVMYPALKCILVGGAPVSPERFNQALEWFGPVLYETYGQTETLLSLIKRPSDYIRGGTVIESVARSAGRPVRFAHVALLDDNGAHVRPGERGEIAVRTSMLMEGYYRKPELTARSRKGGWHLTGDIGIEDDEGYITIVDRKREMIVSGGFNVYPGEVEEVIAGHPAVVECAVVGIPDRHWGEAVHAVIVPRDGVSLGEDELLLWCKSRLGGVKRPKSLRFAEAGTLPRDPQGAIDKPVLRAPYWETQWRKI